MPKNLPIGEDYALAYLKGSFGRVCEWDQSSPIDVSCLELFQSRNSNLLWRESTAVLHFQIKGGPSYFKNSIGVVRDTFETWLKHVEKQPVFLLYVREINATSQEYWFLSLHEWLLTKRGQDSLVGAKPKIWFNVRNDFTQSDQDAQNFHSAIVSEASRAAREEASPWATADDWTVFPFDEAWMLRNMEIATSLELPKSVLEEVQASFQFTAGKQIQQQLSNEIFRVPVVSEWLDSVTKLKQVIPSATSFQRKQFQLFVQTIKAFDEQKMLLRLPTLRVAEMSCWRTFVSIYPRSLRLLHQIILSSPHSNDIMFATALLPILALSDNDSIRAGARQALRSVEEKVSSGSTDYAFQREMRRSLVESGDRRFTASLVDFVAKEGVPILERRFLTGYGWRRGLLQSKIERKLNRPTRRDENLRALYETLGDLLLK